MPLIGESSYPNPPYYLFNRHLETIIPAFRKVIFSYERERLELPDGDFVDLDWHVKKGKKLLILTHGLEGSAERPYVKGMAKLFSENGWNILAWNCRSCSGEMNRNFRLYSHGEIQDFKEVVEHALHAQSFEEVMLVGFSMGGNITMKYLGVHGKEIPGSISKAVAFSSPCDLKSTIPLLNNWENYLYKRRFLNSLKAKIMEKARQFPEKISLNHFDHIKQWEDFDRHYSTPINGFEHPDEFYHYASAINFMPGISIPTLLVNAQNDPLLTPTCSPKALCERHACIFLETPKKGGHVGFYLSGKPYYWSEYRALEFANSKVS